MNIDSMSVNEVIQSISNNSLKISDLMNHFNVSDRTVQTKIKKLGFRWNAKNARYEFNGSDESVRSVLFKSLFDSSIVKPVKTVHHDLEGKSDDHLVEAIDKRIDDIINGDKDTARVQRGIYLDEDLAKFLDGLPNKSKSDFVNMCMRKVLLEKGLL